MKGASVGLGLRSMMRDFGVEMTIGFRQRALLVERDWARLGTLR